MFTLSSILLPYLKLRQEGRLVNHKRVDRLYAEARLLGQIPAELRGVGKQEATPKRRGPLADGLPIEHAVLE